ncbi:MAG TPA: NAD-dependent epimerase/dehydratase family protein [Solirubrobacteraceae bacterium]|nr:NAD-dependent epimerase/dehydratase family protein [Solirubrobacteraceae bacterium]
MRILVTGASGFVGSLLIPRLHEQGHTLTALARDPARVRHALQPGDQRMRGEQAAHAIEVVRGDVLTGEGLPAALADVEVAYYLIHSMERSVQSSGRPVPFADRDALAAHNFAQAAARAGLRRIVYLGGLLPRAQDAAGGAGRTPGNGDRASRERAGAPLSRHLASRAHVERTLLAAVADSLALRASIVIGARSRSFRLLVHLIERLPVLTLPAWHALRTQPIDARDVVQMLAACATARPPRRSLDVGGPDVLSYGQMLETIAELMLVNRPALPLGVKLTGITARLAAAIAGEDPELVLALMEGLEGDLLPAEHHAAQLLGVRLHSFESAVEHSLAEWVQSEPLAAR